MITLEIYQEVSNVVTTDTSGIDSPTIQNRVLVSTVTIKSGDTIMLGGLIRETSEDRKSGLPILHELPIIGALFGQSVKTAERVELVVLIRPVIIATPSDARAVTADLRRKFLTLLQRESTGVRQPRRMVSEDLQ
jgi:general secretion pathway protein D